MRCVNQQLANYVLLQFHYKLEISSVERGICPIAVLSFAVTAQMKNMQTLQMADIHKVEYMR